MAQDNDSKVSPEFRAQMIAWQDEQWATIINPHLEYMEPRTTLRDQFAMAALPVVAHNNPQEYLPKEYAARIAYEIADAMMEARKPKDGTK